MPTDLRTDWLAAYRLTRLMVEDRILDRPRYWLQTQHPVVDELLDCPHCAGMWVAVGVGVCRVQFPRMWGPMARVLAIAGAISLTHDATKPNTYLHRIGTTLLRDAKAVRSVYHRSEPARMVTSRLWP